MLGVWQQGIRMNELTLLVGALAFLAGAIVSHARVIWLFGKYERQTLLDIELERLRERT